MYISKKEKQSVAKIGVNRVTLIGTINDDPITKILQTGIKMSKFTMVTVSGQDSEKEKKEYHKVVMFGGIAEKVEMTAKDGMCVFVEGRLSTSSWDDKKTGQKQYMTQVVATDFQVFPGDIRSDIENDY